MQIECVHASRRSIEVCAEGFALGFTFPLNCGLCEEWGPRVCTLRHMLNTVPACM